MSKKKTMASRKNNQYAVRRKQNKEMQMRIERARMRRPFILATVLPMLIMLIAYMVNNVFPFGEQSILCSDLYNQYLPFFADLRDTLLHGGSLFFSWNLGLGSNFLALYAYYLASPLNWLLIFVPGGLLIEFMGLLIIIKIGLCGLTFSYYLYQHFGKRDYSITVFACFYALSGFICAYNWDIMWLDVVILAPLVIRGLELLVNEKKPLFYCLTLGLSILFNYYLSMLLCIFLVFYFMIQVILLPKEKWNPKYILSVIGIFAGFSILAAGLSSVLLFPVAKALSATKYVDSSFPEKWKLYFSPFLAFVRHFMNVDTEIGHGHWPNLYCGVAVFFLLPYWFLCKNVRVREKIVDIVMILIFLFSFSVNRLDFIWHGMNFPNCLPARQSYLYVFFMVTILYKAYLHREEEPFYKTVIALIASLVLIGFGIWFSDEKYYPDYAYLFTVLFLLVEIVLFAACKIGKQKELLQLVLALVILVELTTNLSYSGIMTSNRANYVKNNKAYQVLLKEIKEVEGNDFYRIESRERKTKNDSMYHGFHSATMFSSTTGEQIQKFYYELGLSSSKVFYWDVSGTPLMNAMLGVRYYFSENDDLDNPFYSFVKKEGNISLYRNEYSLPLGFMVASDLEERWEYTEGNPCEAQDSLAFALGANDILFEEDESIMNEDGKSTYVVKEDGYYYAYVTNKNIDVIEMEVSRMNASAYKKKNKQVKNDYLLDCTYCKVNDVITFTNKDDKKKDENMKIHIYRFDQTAMQQAYESLSRQTMVVDRYNDTTVEAHISVATPGKLVISIPYEEGFTLYVDGKKTEIETFADTMIAVTLPEGEHTIKLKFFPKGFKGGIVVSILSCCLWGFLFYRASKGKKKGIKTALGFE